MNRSDEREALRDIISACNDLVKVAEQANQPFIVLLLEMIDLHARKQSNDLQ